MSPTVACTYKVPSVSVLIAAYNAGGCVGRAIRSAQSQTISDIEIVVVDDASTDDTLHVIERFAALDRRIRVERMQANSGPAASRNAALKTARGEWVAILDADDRFASDRLETLKRIATSSGADIVSDNLALFTADGAYLRRMLAADRLPRVCQMSLDRFIDGCYDPGFSGVPNSFVFMHPMFRRSFLIEHELAYDPASRNGEDLIFYLDCLSAGARWYIIPEALYEYTIVPGSLTGRVSRGDLGRMIRRLRALLGDRRLQPDPQMNRLIRRHMRWVAPDYYWRGIKDAFAARNVIALIEVLLEDRDAAAFVVNKLLKKLSQRTATALASK